MCSINPSSASTLVDAKDQFLQDSFLILQPEISVENLLHTDPHYHNCVSTMPGETSLEISALSEHFNYEDTVFKQLHRGAINGVPPHFHHDLVVTLTFDL